MATPLGNHPEWDPATVDGPAEVALLARSLEKATVLRFASASARDSAFTAASVTPVAGMACALDTSPGSLFVHDGAAWVEHLPASGLPRVKSGRVTLTFNNNVNPDAPVAISFPAGYFTAEPDPQGTFVSSAGAAFGLVPLFYGVSASGMTVTAAKSNGEATTGSFSLSWCAIQAP